MEIGQNWGDVIVFAGTCNKMGRCILYRLKLFLNILRHITQKRVTVIKLEGHKSMDENLGGLQR